MQIAATREAAPAAQVLASQSIDMVAHQVPSGGTTMWMTEREFRLAGATTGLDTFGDLYDAVSAARTLSFGEMPGLAIVRFRGGFRIHDVHSTSRTYWSSSPHGPLPPLTRETKRSSVPFAAGNIRVADAAGRHNPAVVRSDALVALVDGDRAFVPSAAASWAGLPRLVERPTFDI